MATRRVRKPAAPAPAPAPVEELDAVPTYDEFEYEEVDAGISWWKVLIFGGLVVVVLTALCGGVGTIAYWALRPDGGGNAPDGRRVRVDEDLYDTVVDLLDDSEGVSAEDALYLSRVFAGVRDRLLVDAGNESPLFDTTAELVSLASNMGQLALAGNDLGDKLDMEDLVLDEWLVPVFGKEPEDGPVDKRTLDDFIERCGDFADVFGKVSSEL